MTSVSSCVFMMIVVIITAGRERKHSIGTIHDEVQSVSVSLMKKNTGLSPLSLKKFQDTLILMLSKIHVV